MPVKRTTILRWTGRGSVRHLSSSMEYLLRANKVRGNVARLGASIIVSGPDPLEVAALLQHLPGTAWIAAGFGADTPSQMASATSALAKHYLRRGDRFSVAAEGTGGTLPSDVGGAAISRILDAVKGVRVSETAKVVFRVAADGRKGAIGVEVRRGPGGVPTGTEKASCLVSGGAHSSVVAWTAVLAGFRVRLVHVKVSDESVLAVAKLYSELSNRADPRSLSLEVLDAGSVMGAASAYPAGSETRIFGGFHPARGDIPGSLKGKVAAPLFLSAEEKFQAEFESLGIKAFDSQERWGDIGDTRYTTRRFSGGPAGVSDVLDGLA